MVEYEKEDQEQAIEECDSDGYSSSEEDASNGGNTIRNAPHTVVFKCIGAVRDSDSQTTLRAARDKLADHYSVPVRMRPEPTNIKDSRAIMFECEMNGKWKIK